MDPIFNQYSDTLKALITPLKSGETATYRLLTSGQQAVEELANGQQTSRVLTPPNVMFAAQATIYDPYKGENVEIMASDGSVRTKEGLVPKEADITFRNGILVVRNNQPELYRFMELNPANRDCVIPGNAPVKGFQFERVQEAKSDKSKAQGVEMSIKAQTELASYSHDELKRAALRLKRDATASRDAIFVDLISLAQSDGQRVYEAIGDRAVKVEALAAASVTEGVLEWVGDERLYRLKESQQAYLPVPHGDPEEGLVIELMNPRFAKQRAMLEKLVEAKQKAPKRR